MPNPHENERWWKVLLWDGVVAIAFLVMILEAGELANEQMQIIYSTPTPTVTPIVTPMETPASPRLPLRGGF